MIISAVKSIFKHSTAEKIFFPESLGICSFFNRETPAAAFNKLSALRIIPTSSHIVS